MNLKQRVIPGCTVQFKLRQFHKLLRAMHLFSENEVMSAIDLVPGLESSVVKMPNGNKTAQAPILGADIVWRGRRLDGTPVISPAKPILAPSYSIQLHDIQVLVPGRAELERELLASVVSELPNLAKEVPMNRTFSMSMSMSSTRRNNMSLVEDVAPKDRKATILSRFLKVGVHNGRCLVRQDNDDQWLYLKLDDLEDDDDGDLLSHLSPKDVKLINFFKHRFFAVVFMLEYSVRVGVKKGRGSIENGRRSSSSSKGDFKDDIGSSSASGVKVPIVLGGQAYCPCDGKRLRLRNMPRKSDPTIELDLLPDEQCRILTNDLVFTPQRSESLLKTMRAEDPVILGLNMVMRDSKGVIQPDETPLTDAMESESEVEDSKKEEEKEKDASSSSSGFSTDEENGSEDSNSSRETEEPTEGFLTERSDLTMSASESSISIKKPKKHHRRQKGKKRHRRHKEEVSDAGTDDYPPSLISGDAYSSYLRKRAYHRNRRPPRGPSDDLSEFDEWRSGIHVPADKQSLLAQSLQVTLQGPTHAEPEPLPKQEPQQEVKVRHTSSFVF